MSYTPDIEEEDIGGIEGTEVDVGDFKEEDEVVGDEENKGSDSEVDVADDEVDELAEDDDVEQFEVDDLAEDDDGEGIVEDDELNDKQVGVNYDNGNATPKNEEYKPYEETSESDSDSSDDESEDEYVSKVDNEKKMEYIRNTHTQEVSKTYEEMSALTKVTRVKNKTDGEDIIVDETHKTVPILTKYEKTRILGLRVSQLNEGAPRYINVGENIIDNYIIAEKELRLKKLPFIVTRPLPNGQKEHWRLKDLEVL